MWGSPKLTNVIDYFQLFGSFDLQNSCGGFCYWMFASWVDNQTLVVILDNWF
jgi:hypothetical protein